MKWSYVYLTRQLQLKALFVESQLADSNTVINGDGMLGGWSVGGG